MFPALFSVIFSACFLVVTSIEAQLSPKKTKVLTPTEKWIVEQVAKGEIADLTAQFPNEIDRKVSAKFLEDLLTATLPGLQPSREGVRIMGATIEEPLDLSNTKIPYEVFLPQCEFMSNVTFLGASFEGTVLFDDSTFKAEAGFVGVKIRHDALFRRVAFEGPVDFVGAEIAGEFQADESLFKDQKQGASFNMMKIGQRVYFRKVVFEGPVNFRFANIASDFVTDEAGFQNKEQGVDFNGMKVGHSAFLRKAIFEGPVDFISADIASNFEAQEVQFRNKGQGASFAAMRIGQHAFLQRAVFEGSVDFTGSDVIGDFDAREARFTSRTERVLFGMKCGRTGFFRGISFAGFVSFADSSFLNLFIEEVVPGATEPTRLDLSRSSIKQQLRIRKVDIRELIAASLHVEGPAEFVGIIVRDYADLSDGNFTALDLSASVWPKGAGVFHLEGMNYKYIRASPGETESHRALLQLADQAEYAPDVYNKLEAFFRRQGYMKDADRAFHAMKRRERNYLSGVLWIGSLISAVLTDYGRRPSLAALPCVFFVILGCLLFREGKMEVQKPEYAPRVYNPFWYSLGLFLPFVDLQADKIWKPQNDRWFLRHYMRVHILLGWILIPIVLAAFTGLLK